MNREEFLENVDFSLVLNEWAASQPGYKSPVTETEVQNGMAALRPLLKDLQNRASDRASLNFQVLVLIMNKKSPKPKLPISMEVSVVKIQQAETDLLKLKLLEKVGDELEATELGKRFVQDRVKREKTEK